MKKHNYQITIGYKAVITINVKEISEEEAKRVAIEIFKIDKNKMFRSSDINLEDDNFKADGCLNMDETWNMINN
jgi:hypothetical protein